MRDIVNIASNGLPRYHPRSRLLRLAFIAMFSAVALLARLPNVAPGGVVNAASFQQSIQPGAWVSIFGTNLSVTTRRWSSADFTKSALPTSLDGVSVRVADRAAFVQFVSPTQINIETPPDLPMGPVILTVENNGTTSAPVTVTVTSHGPALFALSAHGGRYAAALINNSNGEVEVAAADALYGIMQGVATATQGQILTVFGTGFGQTHANIPAGVLFTGAYELAFSATATIGGASAKVLFAGRVAPGLDQINVIIPWIPDGDYPLVISVNEQVSQSDLFLSVGPGVNASIPGVYNPIAKAQNSTVILGDSISVAPQDHIDENWASQIFVRSNAEVLKIGAAGVTGNTTAQMLARVHDVIALRPATCVLLGGTNDIGGDLAVTINNIDQIVKTLQQNGIRPILTLIPPLVGHLAEVIATNAAIRAYAINAALHYVDFFAVLSDPVTGNYRSGYSADGIHPNEFGAEAMAKKFLDSTQRFFMPVPSFLPTISNGGNNLLGANALLRDSDGDGLADGWSITSGSGSLAFAPDSDGLEWQSITSLDSSFEITSQFVNSAPQTVSDGDLMAFVGRVKLSHPGGVGTGTVSLHIISGGTESVIWPLAEWATNLDDNTIYHEFTLPPRTASINIHVSVKGAGANIKIAQFGLYSLSSLSKTF